MNERTKQDILRAYNKLITKYDMEKISVEMIIKEALISRATFYRYFKDKYDVMNYNYKVLLDNYIAPDESSSYLDLFEKLFINGRKHLKFLQKAFSTLGVNSLCDYISSYSYFIAEEITKTNRNGKGFTESEKLQFDVFIIGISSMYKNWIFDKYDISPQVAAKSLYDIMPISLRDLWWKK